jgi:tRNA-uridine 2-sulfurtransferase
LIAESAPGQNRASVEALRNHVERPTGRGHTPRGACTGAAGGAACGDLVRLSLGVDPRDSSGLIADAGFDARGCAAAVAAGSAAVSLVRGAPLLVAAKVGPEEIANELGGLTSAKRHAADLAADALQRALGAAARSHARLGVNQERTLVAMSGGVDSTVAAVLSAEGGQEVIGVTLELWSDPENDGGRSCCSAQAVRAARDVAHSLGLPHLSIDLRAEFRAGVVEPWLSDHARGLTPYPCLRCNGNVRLDAMLELGERLGAPILVTGHYARLHHEPRRSWPLLRLAADARKDQSYALAGLAPESLARLRFPLGDLSKAEVRALATRAGLSVAGKPDSQDLCFLAGTDRGRFLERHGSLRPSRGTIVDERGASLGEHRGYQDFTVGQRHGLGIGGRSPLFVLATDARTNTVTVGPRARLLRNTVEIEDAVLRDDPAVVDSVKVRSRGVRMGCRLVSPGGPGDGSHLIAELLETAERTAPGQVACLYSGDVVVGHGTIAHESIGAAAA